MHDERNRRRPDFERRRDEGRWSDERGFDANYELLGQGSDSERTRADWHREDLGRDHPGGRSVGAPMYARRYASERGPGGWSDEPYGRDMYPGDVGASGNWPEDRGRRDTYGRDMYPGNSSREGYAYAPGRERGYGGYTGETYGATGEYGQDFGRHRGHGPRDYTRSDARVHEDVCDHLSEDGYVDARDIIVLVSNGEVTLSGTVPERTHKRRAEDLAEGISGVRNVQNNLRVADASQRADELAETTSRQGHERSH